MKRPFVTGVVGKRTTIHLHRITPEQMQRLLRDIFSPVPLTNEEAKALMAPAKSKVVS